jgi:hypothetical protein
MNKLEIYQNGSKVNELIIVDKYREIAKLYLQSSLYNYKLKLKKIYNTNDVIITMTFKKELFERIIKYEYKYFFEDVEF